MLGCRIGPRVFHAAAFLIAAGPAVFGASDTWAATASANFTVSATVLASCAVTAGNLAFGDYTPGSGAANTASSTVSVTCTDGTAYTVALDGGTVSGDMSARNMKDASGDLLSYGLYTTSAYATVWGDGTGSTGDNGDSGNGSVQPYTVFGRIPANQYVAPASYSDQISVTVSY